MSTGVDPGILVLTAPDMTLELRSVTPKRLCSNCYHSLSEAKQSWYSYKERPQ